MDEKSELEILEFWKKNKIQKKALDRRKGGKKFYMCDGPPFANGEIHLGHVWNKALKDAFIKYKILRGYDVYVRAGFDTHGLPIELKVEKNLGFKDKRDIEKYGTEKFIKKCKEFVDKFIKIQTNEFLRMGVWMNFEDPYITYKNEYIEKTWPMLKKAWEKDLLVYDNYVVPYCISCQVPMANIELEYENMVDPSIFIKFKVDGKKNEYLVIWTTTPWTLVGNVAVMAHPMLKYVKAEVDGETWIFAKERLEAVQDAAETSVIIKEEFAGKKLAEVKYIHPLSEEVPNKTEPQPIVMSDEYVTTEEGSGLVHTAPGHGPEDFIIGKRYDLPIFAPVGPDGNYTKEAGKFEGKNVFDANSEIIELLDAKGTLIKATKINHRYPHCWRCKKKLIHTVSKQWFIKIGKIKDKMISENLKINWTPKFAGKWFGDFLESARDWCISRQRYWGIPMPIWKCVKCENIKVIGSKKELNLKKDIELHRPYIDEVKLKCEKCGGESVRVPDVLDVWFDSGNAIWAGLKKGEEEEYPSDFILEGKDQIRGWFYSLLGSGMILNDESPYNSVLMHGFVVDEKGMAMHKSMGNYTSAQEVFKKYPVDVVRLWALTNTIWEDTKFTWKELDHAKNELNILWNVGTYIERFYKPEAKPVQSTEDKWIISKVNTLIKECTEHMDAGESNLALRKIRWFVVEDLSRFYIKLVKKRDDISTLREVFLKTLVLISPFTPFLSEILYRKLYAKETKEESIFFLNWPSAIESEIDEVLEKQIEIGKEIVEAVNGLRAKTGLKLRWPLDDIVIVTKSTEVKESVKAVEKTIRVLTNVKHISVDDSIEIKLSDKAKEELGPDKFKKISELKDSDETKFLSGRIEIGEELIDFSNHLVAEKEGFESKILQIGGVLLNTVISDELKNEAFLNEIRRRIQMMRKELGLVESDTISVKISGGKRTKEIVTNYADSIKGEINAKEISFGTGGKNKKSWTVENESVTISVDLL